MVVNFLLYPIIGFIVGALFSRILNLGFSIWKGGLIGIIGSLLGGYLAAFLALSIELSLLTSSAVAILVLLPFKVGLQKSRNANLNLNSSNPDSLSLRKELQKESFEKIEINKQVSKNKTPKVESTEPNTVLQPIPIASVSKLSREEVFELKDLVANNKFNLAIEKMLLSLQSTSITPAEYDDLVIIKGRLHELQNSIKKGVLTHNEEIIEKNKIRDNVLIIINQLQ